MTNVSFDADRLVTLCRANDVSRLGVFGSAARGEDAEDSDLDLLVEFSRPKSLLDLIALERRIAEVLGRPVDLLTTGALSPYLRDHIMRDLKIVYAA